MTLALSKIQYFLYWQTVNNVWAAKNIGAFYLTTISSIKTIEHPQNSDVQNFVSPALAVS